MVNTYEYVYLLNKKREKQVMWEGKDERGLEIEVIAFILKDYYFIIHAMPLNFRRQNGKI